MADSSELSFVFFTAINITTLLSGFIAMVCAVLTLIIFIYYRLLHAIPNLLTFNSTIAILILSSDTFSIAIYVLYRDMKRRQQSEPIAMTNLFLCHLRGYFAHISFCALIYSYVIQAFYRLAGTIYYHRIRFRKLKIYIYIVCLQWTFAALQLLPIGLGNNQEFIEEEYLCQIQVENSTAIGYICSTNYLLPLTIIFIMYYIIVRSVRQREANGSYRYNIHRVRRQIKLVRRIFILIGIALVLGTPYSVFILMEAFSIRRAPLYSHRVGFMFIAIATACSMTTIIYFTRSLRKILIKLITIKSRNWQHRDELVRLNPRMRLNDIQEMQLIPKVDTNPTSEDTETNSSKLQEKYTK